jgi:hypothetical protein
MNRVELPHDKARFGPLRAAIDGRPELVRLVALIRAFAETEDRALPEAARLVLDRLAGLELFKLQAASDALRVDERQAFNVVWPSGGLLGAPMDKSELETGTAGALSAMRRHWVKDSRNSPDCPKSGWDTDQCAGLAILRADAEALFPEVFEPESAQLEAGAAEVEEAPASAAAGAFRELLMTIPADKVRPALTEAAAGLFGPLDLPLVPLADLADALGRAANKPPATLLEGLIAVMTEGGELVPYLAIADGIGQPVPADRVWVKGANGVPARTALHNWQFGRDMMPTQGKPPKAEQVGVPGLLACLRVHAKRERRELLTVLRGSLPAWCNVNDARLAVPLPALLAMLPMPAAETVAQPADAERTREKQQLKPGQKAELPPAKELQAEIDALKAQKHKSPTAEVAGRYGVAVDTIQRRVSGLKPKAAKKEEGAKAPDPSAWVGRSKVHRL